MIMYKFSDSGIGSYTIRRLFVNWKLERTNRIRNMGTGRGKWCLLCFIPSVTSLLAFSASRIVPSHLGSRLRKMTSSINGAFDADSVERWEELYYASGGEKSKRYVLLMIRVND
jgi:hypothetical protein